MKIAEHAILKLKNLNLSKDKKIQKFVNGKSEIGHIATAIDSLYDTFSSIIDTLNGFYGTVIPFFLKEENELICDHPGKMGSIALF